MKKSIATAVFLGSLTMSGVANAFSVGTQNLYHYKTRLEERKTHLAQEIAGTSFPEIVGFQEAARWVGTEHLFDSFVRLTHYTGIYKSTNNFLVMNDGVALVSKLPARNLRSLSLPNTKPFSNQAINIGFFTTSSGEEVAVINAHLIPSSDGRTRRISQVEFILSEAAKIDLPLVIMGDLNDGFRAESTQKFIQAGFKEVMSGEGATYVPDENPLVTDHRFGPSRLDYIFYRPEKLKVVSAGLMFTRNWVSDHYGLRAEFEINH